MYDIIIRNGTIIDGTGKPMYRADVGIYEDRIKKIGDLHDEKAEREIEAYGKMVVPGFIDVNNHSDTYWQMFLCPNLESLVSQGITTIVGGNCGSSLAPLTSSKNIETIQKWADIKKVNVNWLTLDEFFNNLKENKLAVNFATLIGHGTIRRGILGDEPRNLNPKELNFLKETLSKCFKSGALGMSTGLVYTHARLASEEELRELAKVVATYNGVYTSHIRGEAEDLIESMEEALKIAQSTKVKMHISHLKAMGEANWPKMDEALAIIDHAKVLGIDITFDVYPYTNTGSVLYALLPSWISEGGKKMMIARLKDPVIRAKVIEEMKQSNFDYAKVEISISSLDRTLARRKISDIALSQEKSIEDAVIDILIASDGRVIASMDILSENNIRKAISHPLSIISTNGSGYNVFHVESGEMVHPRCFGTFTKVLSQYVAREGLLSWEDAIKKMTGLPAQKFGLEGKGLLAEGYGADVVIFESTRLNSPATKDNPYQYSEGIDYVIVNGKVTLEDGKVLWERYGKILKK